MFEAASVDFLEIGHALLVVAEDLVEQADGVVDSHDGGEHNRCLVLLVGLLEML